MIKNSKNKKNKVLLIIIGVTIIVFIIIFARLILLVIAFSIKPEHIIEKNNKKYVAYVSSFLNVDVSYYDYINPFFVGNIERIHENYGKGGYDPFDGMH